MTADYNGWADRPEEEREAEEAAEEQHAPAGSQAGHPVGPSRDQIALVQATWQQVAPIADTAARLFYGRLFELEPDLRSLFGRTDIAEQRRKLMQMLAVRWRRWTAWKRSAPRWRSWVAGRSATA